VTSQTQLICVFPKALVTLTIIDPATGIRTAGESRRIRESFNLVFQVSLCWIHVRCRLFLSKHTLVTAGTMRHLVNQMTIDVDEACAISLALQIRPHPKMPWQCLNQKELQKLGPQ
jgi:hypothetical protein